MHNLTKIKFYRRLLYLTYPVAWVFLYPIALLKRKQPGALFFFFDRYAIGGAQRVHLDILESVSEIPKKVYFTRLSENKKLKGSFYSFPFTRCRDIHFWCDNLLFRLFTVHYYAFYLNRHRIPTVLSSNSTFFYDMLPFLNRNTYTIELLHNFTYGDNGMEFFGLANHRYLTRRMVIDAITKERIRMQYQQYKIGPSYFDRVKLVEFGVQAPPSLSKDLSPPLKVLYAGRGGNQKRVWLVSRVADYFLERKERVEFHFAGTMLDDLSEATKAGSVIHGELGDKAELDKLYQECHVIILTSSYEGFPAMIKEGMAWGCVPVVTALEGNKIHLRHLFNAMLIGEIENENEVVAEAIRHLQLLVDDPALLGGLSRSAYEYARMHFSKDAFIKVYRDLLATGL